MKIKINQITEQFDLKGLFFIFALMVGISFFLDINILKEVVKNSGVWAPLLFVVIKSLTIIIAPLAGSPLYPLVGLLFGFWPGILYVAIGDFIGYSVSFYISRLFGQKAIDRMISKNETSLTHRLVEKMSTGKGFFEACLTCFAVPELLSYSAGLSKLKYWKFILILWPASTTAAAALVLFGTLFDTSNQPLLLTIAMPLVGIICVLVGGTLFIRDLKK